MAELGGETNHRLGPLGGRAPREDEARVWIERRELLEDCRRRNVTVRIEGICPEFADCWLSVIVMRDERVALVVRSKAELLQRDGDGGGAGSRKADAIDLARRRRPAV